MLCEVFGKYGVMVCDEESGVCVVWMFVDDVNDDDVG